MTREEQYALDWACRQNFQLYSRYRFFSEHNEMQKMDFMPFHQRIYDVLEAVITGQKKRVIINIPPRHGKTQIGARDFITYGLGVNPRSNFMYLSYAHTMAKRNMLEAVATMAHPFYRRVFPETELSTINMAEGNILTSLGGSLTIAGAGGSITGAGAGDKSGKFAGAIIIDDPHKAHEARSKVKRDSVIDWYKNTVISRLNSDDTPIIVIMQRLHEEDLAGWLLDGGDAAEWELLKIPCLNEDGSTIYPKVMSTDRLKAIEQTNPYVYAGQYMQEPAPEGGGDIKPENIAIIDALPHNAKDFVRGWDLAATSQGGDYTAGAHMCKLADGRYCIIDLVHGQFSIDERDNIIKQTVLNDSYGTLQSFPQDAGQAGKTQALMITRMLAGYNVKCTPETGSKAVRAAPLASQINAGNVCMLKAAWNRDLINELKLFPNAKHDDIVDACSRAFSELIPASNYDFFMNLV